MKFFVIIKVMADLWNLLQKSKLQINISISQQLEQ